MPRPKFNHTLRVQCPNCGIKRLIFRFKVGTHLESVDGTLKVRPYLSSPTYKVCTNCRAEISLHIDEENAQVYTVHPETIRFEHEPVRISSLLYLGKNPEYS